MSAVPPDPTAVLLIRVWLEPHPEPLRARLTLVQPELGLDETRVEAGLDAICDAARSLLAGFEAAGGVAAPP